MIKLQHYLARLIAPLFLLQALNQEVPGAHRNNKLDPTECKSVALPLMNHTMGVRQRATQYSKLIRGRHCTVFSANPAEDLSELIKQLPDNRVILLSSHTIFPTTPSLTGKTRIHYYIKNEIVLKNGQFILGAADDGFEIVISLWGRFRDKNMVRVGTADNFHFGRTSDNRLSHLTFLPTGPLDQHPVNTIVFAECYNRRLIVEDNLFHLPNWSAVDLDCRNILDASVNVWNQGPGLLFTNNTVIGKIISTKDYTITIPREGVFISLPAIRNQSKRVALIGNTIRGVMADAGQFELGPGNSMDVFRNRVDIINAGPTLLDTTGLRKTRRSGFVLKGHSESDAERPLYNLAGNQIRVTGRALTVIPPLELALACNHLQGYSPWLQLYKEFTLKAADPFPLAGECKKFVSSTFVMSTPASGSYTISQIENSWTAINNCSINALSGLTNVEGKFFFGPEDCLKATTLSPGNNNRPAGNIGSDSSTATTSVTTGLVVITALALLLNL
ncbi:hypothetical protein [Endozoicomonas sp. 8E]|uniref:hypothetical protein n=1 Tax=Endozoicomonas sp. 8E TaxID=3035692 RepID=UPI0029391199|nr:hypothetical protein [Endozoicomonas sp. 8E]WOG30072.1 hypothetical protein P6910_10575 [Endozoicomonas sp. 8E]